MGTRLARLFVVAAAALLTIAPALAAAGSPADDGRELVLVELDTPSTLEAYLKQEAAGAAAGGAVSPAAAAARAQLAAVERSQEAFAAALAVLDPGAEEVYRVATVLNGIAVRVSPATVETLRHAPGVRAVRAIAPKRPVTATSVRFIGAQQAWDASGGSWRGDGVKIGIIDTGVDYIHRDFGGNANYSGQRYDDSTVPWTSKVVGGWDFAGDAYTGSGGQRPDGDPMDCNGHGSHVAGIAAGYGVDLEGATYAGPWSAATAFGNFSIGPGVAPGAQLYALKVFGCEGSTGLVTAAINWAVDPNHDGDPSDHLDVINMSVGSPYGNGEDGDALAANRAAQAGVIVVCAAGNEYDGFFITADPGAADRAISVASVGDDGNQVALVTVNSPQAIQGQFQATPAAFGPPFPATPLTRGLVMADPVKACGTLTNAAALAGKIAFVDRGDCNFTDKVKRAQVAGAVAVVVANNVSGYISMAGDDPSITIPSCSITQDEGSVLRSQLPSPGVNITLGGVTYGDAVSDFSSRGPRLGDMVLKPELAAPGSSVTSAKTGSGQDGVSYGGTSMACPHVAGQMALLRQAHPGWTVEELKALAINTARHDVYSEPNQTPPLLGPGRVGPGRVDVPAAAAGSVAAYAADGSGRVAVGFGAVEVVGTYQAERTVRVVNKGAQAVTLALAYRAVADVPGVDVELPDGDTVTVPPGGSTEVRVRLTAVASQMRHTHDPGLPEVKSGDTYTDQPRYWMSEEAGYLELTPQSGQPLRLPVYAAPRPGAVMSATSAFTAGTAGGTATLAFDGVGLNSGTSFPTDIVSLVSAFELQATSAANPGLAAMGEAYSDIKYVGVASDYPVRKAAGGTLAQSYLYFGIVAHGPWNTPSQLMAKIQIDLNRDGRNDHIVETGDLELGADVFVAQTCPTAASGCTLTSLEAVKPDAADTAVFNSNAMVVRVPLSLSGINELAPRFSYKVQLFGSDSTMAADETASLTFDPMHPGLTFKGTGWTGAAAVEPLYRDLPGGSAVVELVQADYQADQGQGILLIHHHNAGDRSQVVGVGSGACALAASAVVPGTAGPNQAVSLQATATSAGCSGEPTFTWDFGDGSAQQVGATVSHAWAAEGQYVWRVTAASGTYTHTRSGTIAVTATQCVLECSAAAAPVVGTAPLPVAFTATATPTGCTGTVTYDWDFGDSSAHSSEQNPSHTYAGAGSFTWIVRATIAGTTCERTGVVEVEAVPPISTPGANVYVVPTSSRNSGLAGSNWVSDLVLHNSGATAAKVNLYFMKQNQDNTAAVGRRVAVPAGQSLRLANVVGSLFNETATSGAILVGSDVGLLISSRTYNDVATGTFGQYIQGYPVQSSLATDQEARLIQLTKTELYRTNIGFANPTGANLDVEVSLYRANASLIGTKTYQVKPYGYAQVTDILGKYTAAYQLDAYAVIRSTTAGAAYFTYASVIDARTNDPINVVPVAAVSGGGSAVSVYLPAAAHLTGAVGTNWRTDLEVHNTGTTLASFSLALLKRDQANGSPVTAVLELPAGQSKRFWDVLANGEAGFSFAGAATVRLRPVTGSLMTTSRTYNSQETGTFGQFIPGQPESEAVTTGQQARLVMLSQAKATDQGFRTNLGVVNTTAAAITVEVTLYKGDGTTLGVQTIPLREYEFKQVDKIFTKVTTDDVVDGFATLSTSTGGGAFIAYASVIDNRSGDPIYIPARASW